MVLALQKLVSEKFGKIFEKSSIFWNFLAAQDTLGRHYYTHETQNDPKIDQIKHFEGKNHEYFGFCCV